MDADLGLKFRSITGQHSVHIPCAVILAFQCLQYPERKHYIHGPCAPWPLCGISTTPISNEATLRNRRAPTAHRIFHAKAPSLHSRRTKTKALILAIVRLFGQVRLAEVRSHNSISEWSLQIQDLSPTVQISVFLSHATDRLSPDYHIGNAFIMTNQSKMYISLP